MTFNITKKEFELMAELIRETCGISLGPEKEYLVVARLSGVLKANGLASFSELYKKIKFGRDSKQILRETVEGITTNETSWFRDLHPFKILQNELLPELENGNGRLTSSGLKIWSAACSTGQEPYSLAMIASEYNLKNGIEKPLQNVNILATDISERALGAAREGKYDAFQISKGLPEDYAKKYFVKKEKSWNVDPALKKCISFRQMNLLKPFGKLGKFDIVFLRNVLIYFDNDVKVEILAKIEKTLMPGGFLFLGAGEMITQGRELFENRESNGIIYYRKKQS